MVGTDFADPVWRVPWLAGLLDDIPAEASLPRLMTVPHPRATGSFGREASEMARQRWGLRLRWWQELAITRALEHDGDGRLVWPEVVESTPRRAGKSVGVRVGSLWRIHQAERFGEAQLVMFTGKDLPICKEIHRKAWPWALGTEGALVRRTNGQEELEVADAFGGSRWIVRGQEAVYGYDVTVGRVDEAWAVPLRVVDDGLEPAMLERVDPQLHLTSTAHRKATGLMLSKIGRGERELGSPDGLLLMLWGADPAADVADRRVWRAASPFWSDHRLELMERKFRQAMSGEMDPDDPDESDPLESFKAQYLNIWPARRSARNGVFARDVWDGWAVPGGWPDGVPAGVVAVESALNGDGLAVARAARLPGGRVVVQAVHVSDLAAMRGLVESWRAGGALVRVGKSIAGLMSYEWHAQPLTSDRFAEATAAFLDACRSGECGHVAGPDLDGQMGQMRVKGIGQGAVLTAKTPVHVARSAVWAVWAVLSRQDRAGWA